MGISSCAAKCTFLVVHTWWCKFYDIVNCEFTKLIMPLEWGSGLFGVFFDKRGIDVS